MDSAEAIFTRGRKFVAVLAVLAVALMLFAFSYASPEFGALVRLPVLAWKVGQFLLGCVLGFLVDQVLLHYLRPHQLEGRSRDIAGMRRALFMIGAGYILAMGL